MTSTLVTLECGHSLQFKSAPPGIGDLLWCYKCANEKAVKHAPDEWRIKCQTCKHSDTFGAAKTSAEIGAGRHRRQKGKETHIVALYNGKRLDRVFDGRMPTLGDAITAGQDPEAPPY